MCSLTVAFSLQEILLPLSLGAAEPARMPWGATALFRLIALCNDKGATVYSKLYPCCINKGAMAECKISTLRNNKLRLKLSPYYIYFSTMAV